MLAKEFMQESPIAAKKGDSVSETKKVMEQNNFRLIFVTGEGDKLAGFLTYDSIDDLEQESSIDDHVSRANMVVNENDPIDKAVSLIKEHKLMVLPVVNDERELVGVITPGKLFEKFSELLRLGEGGFWITLKVCGSEKLFSIVDVFENQEVPLHNVLTFEDGDNLQLVLKAGEVNDKEILKQRLEEAVNG